MKGFFPYHDDPDATVDNWATILESGTSIFWKDLLHVNLEGRHNFHHGYDERVQERDRKKPEDIIHEQFTPQQGTTAAEQTRSPPFNPTINESIPPHATSNADNSMQQLKTCKGGDRGKSSGGGGKHSKGVYVRINGGSDIEAQNDSYPPTVAKTTIGAVVEVESSRDEGEDEKSECGSKNNRGIGDKINGGGDFEAPTCSSDENCEEDVLDVEQPKR
ncbi:hypothetical protein TIFTF001_029840 [Ficus carica]|uniref:Uncharacterized protein n=1 Tax=Ficus carica TaxID=3494 RepID=A0AA88J3B5_FICCA|nr:hypothetical protein TIFTF001_029840 [Ficus carica]